MFSLEQLVVTHLVKKFTTVMSQHHKHQQTPAIPHCHSLFKIDFNIIFQFTSKSPKWCLSLRLLNQISVHISCCSKHATCPVYLILLWLKSCTNIRWRIQLQSSSLCNFLHSPVISSLLALNNLLSTLFSNILNLWSSLRVSDWVSH